jgi:fructose-1,6-bisphosphatase/inositol monophosphatase family enzyme
VAALRAAHATVQRLAPTTGQRVVAGRAAGYRSWDPEVIGVDTATERAVIASLAKQGMHGILLSEEAGERRLTVRSGCRPLSRDPVYIIMDPFDGSLLYRRGIRAHWFTALGIYGQDGVPRAAGLIDHTTEEIAVADPAGAFRMPHLRARAAPLRPAATETLDGAFLEAYMMKPSFLYATATALRALIEKARFILPNGGPGGFADVAAGRIDVYLAWNEALTEVHSAVFIAERAGCVVTNWNGSRLAFTPDIHTVYNLVCSANPTLHREVLNALKTIKPPKGLTT